MIKAMITRTKERRKKMKNIKLGTSPINGTIYAGKTNKNNTMWVGEKQDVTEMATSSVLEHYIVHKDKMLTSKSKKGNYVLRALTFDEHNFLVDNYKKQKGGEND